MRVSTLLTALSLAPISAAQQPQEPHEAMVWDAYQNFRDQGDTYAFEMRGEESFGNSKRDVRSVLYWRNSVDPRTGRKTRAEAELDVFERNPAGGEFMTLRIVGDGTTLRRYDLVRGTVSSTTYGFYGTRVPDKYFDDVKSDAPKLARQLRAATPGLATYLARLVSEINLADGVEFGPRYASWVPGRAQLFFDEVPRIDEDRGPRRINDPVNPADDTVTDPVTGRPYSRGDAANQKYVFVGFGRADADRTAAFTLYAPYPENRPDFWTVRSVNVALRSQGRIVDLTIMGQAGPVPDGAFQPYAGAQGAAFRPTTPER